jgi:hypothetical protein
MPSKQQPTVHLKPKTGVSSDLSRHLLWRRLLLQCRLSCFGANSCEREREACGCCEWCQRGVVGGVAALRGCRWHRGRRTGARTASKGPYEHAEEALKGAYRCMNGVRGGKQKAQGAAYGHANGIKGPYKHAEGIEGGVRMREWHRGGRTSKQKALREA